MCLSSERCRAGGILLRLILLQSADCLCMLGRNVGAQHTARLSWQEQTVTLGPGGLACHSPVGMTAETADGGGQRAGLGTRQP